MTLCVGNLNPLINISHLFTHPVLTNTADFQSSPVVTVIGSLEFPPIVSFTHEKPELALQRTETSNTALSNAVSQPSVYFSSSSKATWPTVEKLLRSESIAHQVDGTIPPHLDPEFVKRRATTLAIDMSSERQSKAANRRRLFSIFSKQFNSTREGDNLRSKQECPSVDNFPNESTASPRVVQSLVDSLGRHKSDLKFSVSALHDSIVHRGEKNCFQV
ncbi:unnamed protein product [Rodentolepis nana]|uniref:Uncharacterized protein n=1 Tax=Rodentolepis nana TaxID=102285 RepID=A0A158QH76_RODNA|nr:unnamed protein product [Rodentolepis nana]